MKVLALAGGVGGAKLVDGLAQVLPAEDLTVVVNTGDDFQHLGLKICPDLDTVCYTLAGLANPATGWGRDDETWNSMDSFTTLGGPAWFRLGDRDLGTHLERTRQMKNGRTLSQVTRSFCEIWGIGPTVLPMSDDPVPTIVITDEGELPFQEYFVQRRCEPKVSGFRFDGVRNAEPAPGLLEAIRASNLVVICPSNPWVSIDPILELPGVRAELVVHKELGLKILAVSPIIGGQAVKGPVTKMYQEMGIEPSALAVADHYVDLLDLFVYDVVDIDLDPAIRQLKIQTQCFQTLMKSKKDRKYLASEILGCYHNL
jgi:LPPG:FO 2-phospho-L-lactate transferase